VPSNLELIPNAVMVEGKNDYYLIKYFESCLKSDKKISLLPGTGAGDLNTLISLYLGWGRSFIIILDDDKAGRMAKNKYINEWSLSDRNVFTLGELNDGWQKYKIENLIDDVDKEKIREEIYPDNTLSKLKKKDICRAIQEKLLNGTIDYFSLTTIRNFEKLIDVANLKLQDQKCI
jgi:hypothetical protein